MEDNKSLNLTGVYLDDVDMAADEGLTNEFVKTLISGGIDRREVLTGGGKYGVLNSSPFSEQASAYLRDNDMHRALNEMGAPDFDDPPDDYELPFEE